MALSFGAASMTSRLSLIHISLINLVSQPLLSYFGDNHTTIKNIVLAGMAITIPGAYLLGPTVGFLPLALVSVLVVAFFDYSMIGLIDTWINLTKEHNSTIQYSVARGMGSLSSAVTAVSYTHLRAYP